MLGVVEWTENSDPSALPFKISVNNSQFEFKRRNFPQMRGLLKRPCKKGHSLWNAWGCFKATIMKANISIYPQIKEGQEDASMVNEQSQSSFPEK